MRWICYDESETFCLEAKNLEDAKKLASAYEAKVLGPFNNLPGSNVQAGNKVSGTKSSAQHM